MITPFVKHKKYLMSRHKMTVLLVCILTALIYLHSDHHPLCICIYPDEIMDLPCSISPLASKDEKIVYVNNSDLFRLFSYIEAENNTIYFDKIRTFFSINYQEFTDCKERLFLLRRYNSWYLILNPFHSYIIRDNPIFIYLL